MVTSTKISIFSLFTAVFPYTKALFNQPLFYPLPSITLMDLLQNKTFRIRSLQKQSAKKVLSDSPHLSDLSVGQVDFINHFA